MNGSSAPYYVDAQGVYRCSCCGAPLFKPSQQFDQQPASNWGWPSFHSPPINGDDGLPNVCHVGSDVTSSEEADDLGLHVEGEVRCSHCGHTLEIILIMIKMEKIIIVSMVSA